MLQFVVNLGTDSKVNTATEGPSFTGSKQHQKRSISTIARHVPSVIILLVLLGGTYFFFRSL